MSDKQNNPEPQNKTEQSNTSDAPSQEKAQDMQSQESPSQEQTAQEQKTPEAPAKEEPAQEENKPEQKAEQAADNKPAANKKPARGKKGRSQNKAPANQQSAQSAEKPAEAPVSETPKTEAPQAAAPVAPQAPASNNEQQSGGKGSKTLATIAIILSLGAVSAAGYTVWLQKEKTVQQMQALADANEQLRNQLQQQGQQISSLNSLKPLSAKTQQLASEQSKQRQQMIDLAGELAKSQAPKPSDWLQAEAEYLLRLANHRLQLEGDIKGAEKLLASADKRLMEADNPSLFAVREAIADERLKVSTVTPVDTSGLFFALAALENQIDQLPLPMEPGNHSQIKNGFDMTLNDEVPVWKAVWQEAKSLVIIRHRDEAITPLLPPEESMYLRHNLRLTIQQAQIAMVKGETKLYTSLLTQASQWIKDHFDMTQHKSQAVVAELDKLSKATIELDKPEISGSLQQLRELQQERFKPVAKKES